jgi:uncharacterized protein (TIGR00725 family)
MSHVFVAVVGGSTCTADEARVAEAVGRGLAGRGAALVCGGLGGIMEAACRGAKSNGGLTVGILPGDDRLSANPHVDVPVVTGMGHARNAIVVKTAQAVIAIDGSYGTLSEIALALQNGIAVIGLGTWTLSLHGQADKSIIEARDAEEAVEKAIAAAGKGRD